MNGIESNPFAGENADEPVDLADAFSRVVKANAAAAQSDLAAEGQPSGMGVAAEESGADEGQEQVAVSQASTPDDSGDEGDGGLGGSADVIEPIDYNAQRKAILDRIQREALSQTRKVFNDEKIQPITIDMLYQRDEQTGRVTFQNPDDQRNPFTSRAEAQSWVDAMNKQINQKFRMDVNKKQQELLQSYAPQLRVLDFKATYDSMDQLTKDIFDDMLEPYGITDSQGNVIGFNVDLASVARQAMKLSKRFGAQQPQATPAEEAPAEEAKKGSKPAMDMKTGASKSDDLQEPKTIGEALKMYDKKKGKK